MRHRLQRLDRIYRHGPIYFLTLCTATRKPILDNPLVLEAFRNFGLGAKERGVHVGRYVIMPDHLHLFVAPAETVMLGAWVKSLKTVYRESFASPAILLRIGRKVFLIMS
jgi:putative transposase